MKNFLKKVYTVGKSILTWLGITLKVLWTSIKAIGINALALGIPFTLSIYTVVLFIKLSLLIHMPWWVLLPVGYALAMTLSSVGYYIYGLIMSWYVATDVIDEFEASIMGSPITNKEEATQYIDMSANYYNTKSIAGA